MGNQCACQKIESEEEILSRIIGNMKLKEIETKCVYYEFLNCIDTDDKIINFFLFSNFISKIIGNNMYYKLPQTNFFENLRKRSDNIYANIKAIGIILILFSNGDEKTKINFIIEYFFALYNKLNEKTVKEFLGYIIDSQTDNCIVSFREIYSYESIKAFKEIYSKSRRKLLINLIYENFQSVKLKYLNKIISNNKEEILETNFSDNSHMIKKAKIKHKRKAESLIYPRNSIRNKLQRAYGYYNTKNEDHSCKKVPKNNYINMKKKALFCREQEDLSLYRNPENFFNNFYQFNEFSKKKNINKLVYETNENGYIKDTSHEKLKVLNINATSETDRRRAHCFKNMTNKFIKKKNESLNENMLMARKISNKDNSMFESNLETIVERKYNSDERISAKFKSESDKSNQNQGDQNKNSENINEKKESFNLLRMEKDKLSNDNQSNENHDLSFCRKNSSNKNVLDNGYNLDEKNIQNNTIIINEKSPAKEKLTDNKEKNISFENDKLTDKLNCNNLANSKVISVDRISFYSNVNNNYEKYNKGQCDKMIKNQNLVQLLRNDPICHEEKNESKVKIVITPKQVKINANRKNINEQIHIDEKIINNANLNQTILKEFLDLSYQFFNGDTIRNWLYDNYLREKLNN